MNVLRSAVGQVVVAGSEVVAQPELGIHRSALEVVSGTGGDCKGREILVGILPELVHAFQFIQKLVVIASNTAAEGMRD